MWRREDGADFSADFVLVLFESDKLKSLEKSLTRYGFQIEHVSTSYNGKQTAAVRVPAGSVNDAVELLRKQDGIISADLSSWRSLQG